MYSCTQLDKVATCVCTRGGRLTSDNDCSQMKRNMVVLSQGTFRNMPIYHQITMYFCTAETLHALSSTFDPTSDPTEILTGTNSIVQRNMPPTVW